MYAVSVIGYIFEMACVILLKLVNSLNKTKYSIFATDHVKKIAGQSE